MENNLEWTGGSGISVGFDQPSTYGSRCSSQRGSDRGSGGGRVVSGGIDSSLFLELRSAFRSFASRAFQRIASRRFAASASLYRDDLQSQRTPKCGVGKTVVRKGFLAFFQFILGTLLGRVLPIATSGPITSGVLNSTSRLVE